ncbi:cyclic nucleotide-binding domain-containing protein [Streptosporangium vulgare]|uniref:Cyclic nucleotide-binding domain-containing protein n=1 Tax=Streptosporangium vulgare TaxID=46190 RepID=A0ABV5TF63_9ACTN
MRWVPASSGASPWPAETFLARLPEPSRQTLLALGGIHTYPADHVIVRQGESADLVSVVVHGLVKVTARTENGRESLLAVQVRGRGRRGGRAGRVDALGGRGRLRSDRRPIDQG